jgi:hypothetical protein
MWWSDSYTAAEHEVGCTLLLLLGLIFSIDPVSTLRHYSSRLMRG